MEAGVKIQCNFQHAIIRKLSHKSINPDNMTYSNLRKQVLIPLSLTFLVLLGSFLYSAYIIKSNNISDALNRHYHETQSLFNELLTIKFEGMLSTAEQIVNDPALQQGMLHQDRARLLVQATTYYRKMVGAEGITRFYFHTPDGHNLLRLHRPQQYGDLPTGNTLQRVMETKSPAHGLELASTGALTLCMVIPWYSENRLIGFIELGTEIDDVVRKLAAISHTDYLIALDKTLLDRKNWESVNTGIGHTANWELLPDKVISGHSLVRIPNDLLAILSRPSTGANDAEDWKNVRLDSTSFAARRFPLVETGGRTIGEFVLLHDTTRMSQDFYNFVFKVVILGLGLCLVLFAFAWRILGQVTSKLQTAQKKLADEVDNVHKANLQLEQEVVERKRVEAELTHLNDHLEERVSQRTKALEEASRELAEGRNQLEQAYLELKSRQAMILHQDKMACIGLLAAGVAHDINNPIGFVTNNLEELRDYLERLRVFIEIQQQIAEKHAENGVLVSLANERQKLGIDYILEDFDTLVAESLDGAGRITDIVKNLRNFSRTDGVEYRLADINTCLDSTINITHHELRYKAQVERNFGTLPMVRCCPEQLNQVFMNLLINAAHAIEKQGKVTITTWAEEQFVFVEIADTGCGIPADLLSKIFEPFFTTKEVGLGTGLGLSIVYDIINQHKGKITVKSKPDEGTKFTIMLPV